MPKITINEVNATVRTPIGETSALPIGLIGTANYGPVNTPTVCNTVAEFQEIFGSSLPTYNWYGYLAAQEVLMLGNQVLFTRIYDSGAAAKASVVLQKTETGSAVGINSITVTANYYGSSGNDLSVKVTEKTAIVGTTPATYTIEVIKGSVTVSSFVITGTSPSTVEDTYVTLSITSYPTASPAQGLTAGTFALSGGASGDDMSDAVIFSSVSAVLQGLVDPSLFTLINISVPGLCDAASNESHTVAQLLVDFVTSGSSLSGASFTTRRTDVVALIDCIETATSSNVLASLGLSEGATIPAVSYTNTAIFFPWWQFRVDSTTRQVPPSLFYLIALAPLQADGMPGRAVAGPTQGSVTRCVGLATSVGTNTSSSLSANQINPIAYHHNYGYFLDGNNVFNTVAENRTYAQLSIRYTINYIKQRLDDICYQISYRPNSTATRTEFQGAVSTFLAAQKASDFIYAYSMTISETATDLADGVLRASVSIFPTPALEEFVINLMVVNTMEQV